VIRYDKAALGDLNGKRVAHLQCHIGTDTISLSRLGASVVGLDFSEKAVLAARELASKAGSDAMFVRAAVYDAAEALDEKFDLVYTSVGVINWLADLDQWAAAIAGLLDPGGRFFIRDMHPMLWIFEENDGEIRPTYPYFTGPDSPLSWDTADTYVEGDTSGITNTRQHEWNHSIAEIVNALASNGMIITSMVEHQGIDWEFVPSAIKEGKQWFLPEPLRQQVPMMFSLSAVRGPRAGCR
jgi:SAM-dependent methyltransferase